MVSKNEPWAESLQLEGVDWAGGLGSVDHVQSRVPECPENPSEEVKKWDKVRRETLELR